METRAAQSVRPSIRPEPGAKSVPLRGDPAPRGQVIEKAARILLTRVQKAAVEGRGRVIKLTWTGYCVPLIAGVLALRCAAVRDCTGEHPPAADFGPRGST
jgi:hypothetical protein